MTNCPNCGAPRKLHNQTCEYCGTILIPEENIIKSFSEINVPDYGRSYTTPDYGMSYITPQQYSPSYYICHAHYKSNFDSSKNYDKGDIVIYKGKKYIFGETYTAGDELIIGTNIYMLS